MCRRGCTCSVYSSYPFPYTTPTPALQSCVCTPANSIFGVYNEIIVLYIYISRNGTNVFIALKALFKLTVMIRLHAGCRGCSDLYHTHLPKCVHEYHRVKWILKEH